MAFMAERLLAAIESLGFRPRCLRVACGVALLLAIATLFGRPPAFDDAWFGDQAYFVATEGRLRSELFRGMLGWEEWVYITQKAGVLLTAVFVRILGLTPLAVHLPGLIYATLCGTLVVVYLRRVRPGDRGTLLVAGILLAANPSVVAFAFLVRPELMLASLAFASYALLDAVFCRDWPIARRAALAGALAGASPLFHLNGSMIMAAGGLFLLVRRQWLPAAVYSVTALGVALLYVVDALVRGDLGQMVTQFRFDPATAGSTSLSAKLATVGDVGNVFFHSPAEIAISVMLLFPALAFSRLRRREIPTPREARGLVTYSAALLLSLLVLLNRPAHMYALLFCPFGVALFSLLHGQLRAATAVGLRRTSALILCTCLVFGISHSIARIVRNAEARDEMQWNAYVASLLPKKHVAVIAPLAFVFGQIDDYRIMGLAKYAHPDRVSGSQWDMSTLMADAARWDVEYVVFERRRGHHNFDPPEYPVRVGQYERFVDRPPLTIYRRGSP